MSKDGYYAYHTESDLDQLRSSLASTWGGSIFINRFDPIPKVPFQRTLEESLQLYSYASSSSTSSFDDAASELVQNKRQLIEAKKAELNSLLNEQLAVAKVGKSESGLLFDLQRRMEALEEEIQALTQDVERRVRLMQVRNGEAETGPEFDFTHAKYWTDYNKTFWHPSSLHMLSQLQRDSAQDVFASDIMTTDEKEDYIDHTRQAFEACDSLEGLQVFIDADTSFGAIGVDILDNIKDDLGRTRFIAVPILSTFGESIGQTVTDTIRIRRLNRALTLSSLRSMASLVLPFDPSCWTISSKTSSFSHLPSLLPNNLHQLSAILASTFDSLSLPYRSTEDGVGWRQYLDNLAPTSSCNFGLVSSGFPLNLSKTNSLSRLMFGYDIYSNPELRTEEERLAAQNKKILPHAHWMTSTIPLSLNGSALLSAMDDTARGVCLPWNESVVLRGVPDEAAFNPADASSNSSASILFQYLKRYNCPMRHFAAYDQASPVPISYPRFFADSMKITNKVPTLTHVQNTPRLSDFFKIMNRGVSKDMALKYPTLNYDLDRVAAASDALLTLEEDYSR